MISFFQRIHPALAENSSKKVKIVALQAAVVPLVSNPTPLYEGGRVLFY